MMSRRGSQMPDQAYDVIVVGARCAGSPVAMLLARRGYRVLVVDRATFPSDTVSTHFIHPPGVFFFYRYGHHRDLHSFPTRRSSDLIFFRYFVALKFSGGIWQLATTQKKC